MRSEGVDRAPPNLISTPKFEDHKTKDVRQYLTLFESIMIQNNFAQESWALTKRRLETFFELATAEGEISETDTLLKYIILDKVTPGLKTHLVENKISSMSFEEFQIADSSYQEAHGRPGAAQTAADQSGTLDYMSEVPRSVDQATTSVWRVTVEDTRKKIAEMEMPKRRAFVLENRLCFNCLKPGHRQPLLQTMPGMPSKARHASTRASTSKEDERIIIWINGGSSKRQIDWRGRKPENQHGSSTT